MPMWLLMPLLLLQAACGAQDQRQQPCQSGKVVELDDSSFNAAISQCRYILVDFYAPWCSHCRALSPQLDEVAAALDGKNQQQELILAKIDVDKFTAIGSKYKISAYPTLKLFIDGIPSEYTGPHQAQGMLAHLNKLLAPELSLLGSASDVTNFKKQAGDKLPIFIALGLQPSALEDVAREHRSRAWFGLVENPVEGLLVEYGLSKFPALLVQHVAQEEEQVFYGPFEEEALAGFVKQNLLPAVTLLGYDNLDDLKGDGRPIVLTIVGDDASTAEVASQMKSVAHLQRDFIFAVLNASAWPALAELFHSYKLVIWTSKSEFYTASEAIDKKQATDLTEEAVRLIQDFKSSRAKKRSTKQPPLLEQLTGFIAQNVMYIILFIVTIVVFLQGMDWNQAPPRPTNHDQAVH